MKAWTFICVRRHVLLVLVLSNILNKGKLHLESRHSTCSSNATESPRRHPARRPVKPNYTLRCLLFVLSFAFCAFSSYSLPQSQGPSSGDRANYVLFDVPNAFSTNVVGINNSGEVTGYFRDSPFGAPRGFVREQNGKITVFDAAGTASGAMPAAINDAGDVAGYFFDAVGVQSFLRNAQGNITVFDVPQLFFPGMFQIGFAMAIDNRGDIAGFIIPCPECDTWVGFVRSPQGDITTFAPTLKGSVPTGINERGDIVGVTSPFYVSREGFVRDRTGLMTVFDAGTDTPLAAYPVGINNRGTITGYYFDTQSGTTRGFVRDSKGRISVFDADASASQTSPAGINDSDEIVGDFSDATGSHHYLRDNKGNVVVFDVPNTSGAHAVCVNNRGDVAGTAFDAQGKARGFLRIANP